MLNEQVEVTNVKHGGVSDGKRSGAGGIGALGVYLSSLINQQMSIMGARSINFIDRLRLNHATSDLCSRNQKHFSHPKTPPTSPSMHHKRVSLHVITESHCNTQIPK